MFGREQRIQHPTDFFRCPVVLRHDWRDWHPFTFVKGFQKSCFALLVSRRTGSLHQERGPLVASRQKLPRCDEQLAQLVRPAQRKRRHFLQRQRSEKSHDLRTRRELLGLTPEDHPLLTRQAFQPPFQAELLECGPQGGTTNT